MTVLKSSITQLLAFIQLTGEVQNYSNKGLIRLSPNPARDYVSIPGTGHMDIDPLSILSTDITGRILNQMALTGDEDRYTKPCPGLWMPFFVLKAQVIKAVGLELRLWG